MKKYMFCILFFGCICIMISCGSKNNLKAGEAEVNTILVKKDGTIQSSLVEEFNKKYYDKTELKDFIEKEVSNYNKKAGGDKVTVSSLEVKDGIASVVFTYANIQDYAEFNQVEAELISASEARDKSIISDDFIDISTNETVAKEKAFEEDNDLVLIIGEQLNITVEGKLKYYANAAVLNQTTVQATGENNTVVVFK